MNYFKAILLLSSISFPNLSFSMEYEPTAASAAGAGGGRGSSKTLPTFDFEKYNADAHAFNEDQAAFERATEDPDFDPSAYSFLDDIELPKPKTAEELLAEEEARKAKLEKLIIYERNFLAKGTCCLRGDEITQYQRMCRAQTRGPVALLKLAEEISDETRQRNLLEYLMGYNWMRFEEFAPEECVPGQAACLLFDLDRSYLRSQDFSRPDTLNMSALFHVLGHIRSILREGDYYGALPMSDPGDPLLHFDSDVRYARQQIITWHVNTVEIPTSLTGPRIEKILTEANRLAQSTTYGFFGKFYYSPVLRFDLLHQLLRRGYIGFAQESGKNADGSTSYQHLWLHPDLPISVRVKDNGQFSIGVLREMPFSSAGKIKKSFLTRGAQSEVFKASDAHLIPARHPRIDKTFSALWEIHEDDHVRGLMATAHFRFGIIDPRLSADGPIEYPYFDFDRAARELT